MRFFLAILLTVHGLIHSLGFIAYWQLASIEGMNYKNTLLYNNLGVGDAGIRVVGVLWLLAAIGFVVAGVALFTLQPWWQILTLWVALFSLIISILGWPDSKFGVLVNLVILAFLLFKGRLGWLH